MSPAPGQPVYQNPKQVIEDRLPELKSGPANERTTGSALRHVFTGPMDSWHDFNKQLSMFYANQQLQNAFTRTSGYCVDFDATDAAVRIPYFAGLDHTHVAEENSTHSAFKSFAVNRVFATVKALFHDAAPAQTASVKNIPLTNDWAFGTTKITPKDCRAEYEPDFVFKIPGEGDNQKERVVGEMKFFGTCEIGEEWGNPGLQTRGSMRHVFGKLFTVMARSASLTVTSKGQVARDMRERGLRFGFVSTYEQTVFLKIGEQASDGSYALFYSDIVYHTDRTILDPDQQTLTSVSVRLGLLYLLHRATNEDASTWSFKPQSIRPNKWTRQTPNNAIGTQAVPYTTPSERTIPTSSQQEMNGDQSPSIARGLASNRNIQLGPGNTGAAGSLGGARTTRLKVKQDTEERG